MNTPRKSKTRVWLWLIALAIVPIAVIASWAGTEYFIEHSSGEEFCTTCHTMESVGEAYEKTKHGGKNRLGFKASCADCHLPHDSHTNYLITKAVTGVRDMWAQFTHDPENPTDWQEKRKDRHQYVFDSACLKCHSEKTKGDDPSHPAYFAGGDSPFKGQGKFRCVDCHFYVGHSDASEWFKTGTEQ